MEMSDGRGQRSMREGEILWMGILEAGGSPAVAATAAACRVSGVDRMVSAPRPGAR